MRTYTVQAYVSNKGYTGMAMVRIYKVTATSTEHAKNKVRYIARKRGQAVSIERVSED